MSPSGKMDVRQQESWIVMSIHAYQKFSVNAQYVLYWSCYYVKDRALFPVFQELQVSAGVEGNINILFSFLYLSLPYN